MFSLNKTHIIIICGICSAIGIFLIYYTSILTPPKQVEVESINQKQTGNYISTEGTIISRTMTKTGHLFLTIQGGTGKLDVIMFSSFLKNQNVDPNKFLKGLRLGVRGVVEQYKGQLQIIPKTSSDVKILR